MEANKKTVVLGAVPFPDRYAYLATERLHNYGHTVVPVGIRAGEIAGIPIILGTPAIADVDTITLYLNPMRQVPLYDYILGLKPQRIIFNPGTENPELVKLAQEQGIHTEYACTLVLLASSQY